MKSSLPKTIRTAGFVVVFLSLFDSQSHSDPKWVEIDFDFESNKCELVERIFRNIVKTIKIGVSLSYI